MGLANYIGTRAQAAPQVLFPALTIGFLGGLTTFSAFGNETFAHLAAGRSGVALGNIAANVGIGLLAIWAGQLAAKAIVGG